MGKKVQLTKVLVTFYDDEIHFGALFSFILYP